MNLCFSGCFFATLKPLRIDEEERIHQSLSVEGNLETRNYNGISPWTTTSYFGSFRYSWRAARIYGTHGYADLGVNAYLLGIGADLRLLLKKEEKIIPKIELEIDSGLAWLLAAGLVWTKGTISLAKSFNNHTIYGGFKYLGAGMGDIAGGEHSFIYRGPFIGFGISHLPISYLFELGYLYGQSCNFENSRLLNLGFSVYWKTENFPFKKFLPPYWR